VRQAAKKKGHNLKPKILWLHRVNWVQANALHKKDLSGRKARILQEQGHAKDEVKPDLPSCLIAFCLPFNLLSFILSLEIWHDGHIDFFLPYYSLHTELACDL